MKRNIILLLSLLAFAYSVKASFVNIEKATLVAKNFMSAKAHFQTQPILLKQENKSDKAVFYIFGFESNGFVIISAEDNVYPIIGYSTNEFFDIQNIPVQLSSLMQYYAGQIQYASDNNIEADMTISQEWHQLLSGNLPVDLTESTDDISPFLPCNWDQGKYYNELCPKDNGGNGGHVYVGCVATAMAQVMFYYRYPATGEGTHTYNHSHYGSQSVNYGNTTYDWTGMLNQLSTSNFPVATISYHAAVSINMDFGPDGSGANTSSVPGAFIDHFRYDHSVNYQQSFYYDPTAWLKKIRDNLDLKHPVLYSGNPNNGEAGHCWVIDGYQGNDFFHCNWGWNGSSNGYFYLNALNTGGTNFNYGQGAVFNIFPPDSIYPSYCNGQALITTTTGTIEDGSWQLAYKPFSNCSWLIKPSDSVRSLSINFHRFDTELNDDVVTIYNGETTTAPVLGTYSGSTVPSSISVNSNKLLITFTTDADNEGAGWYLTYSSVLPEYCHGTTLSALTGNITDGSGNRNYQANTTCTWIIQPTDVGAVKIHFTSLDIEPDNDYLKVFDLGTQTLLATLSGSTLPQDIIAYSGSMYLEFRTNSSIQAQGWEASYISLGVGIKENEFLPDLSVYPVPAKDRIVINLGKSLSGQVFTEILSIDGKLIDKNSYDVSGTDKIELNVAMLNSGLYFLRLTGNDGNRIIKFTVE